MRRTIGWWRAWSITSGCLLVCGAALPGSQAAPAAARLTFAAPPAPTYVRVQWVTNAATVELQRHPLVAGVRRWPFAPDHEVLTLRSPAAAEVMKTWLRQQPGVRAVEIMPARQLQKKWVPNDQWFAQQWHLLNTGQNGGTPGVDLRLTQVWERHQGAGVVLGIVDDGVELGHRDLHTNAASALSYDFLDDDADAGPTLFSDTHGTQVAGVAAARGNNGLGVCGVAPQATLASLRLISGPTTDAQEAAALSHAIQSIHIMNCSWGAPDGHRTLVGPGPLTRAALRYGAEQGREGRGIVYVFSAGNGGAEGEDANGDGYVNSIYTLAVGAVSDQGLAPSYSEGGACVHLVAPSGAPLRQRLTTTDLTGPEGEDPGDYTSEFTGTSASAPAVAGVAALMLEANPVLGWRDVQEILLRTARPLAPEHPDWSTNRAGFRFHPRYGAGLADAEAAVALAEGWHPLPPPTVWSVVHSNLFLPIPDNQAEGAMVEFTVPPGSLRVEHAVVTLTVQHPDASQLEIQLLSPHGTRSRLLPAGALAAGAAISEWPFSSVRHWGELPGGVWRVVVADRRLVDTGEITFAQLELHGALPPSPALSPVGNPPAFRLTLPAPPGVTPWLEVSENLADWQPAPLAWLTNGQAVYFDTNRWAPRRFFRGGWAQP